MRNKIIAGNWKMNLNLPEAQQLFNTLNEEEKPEHTHLLIFPPSIYLAHFSAAAEAISIGAQDVSAHEVGAYTGEVSAEMLSAINVDFCLVGHSERREYHQEDNVLLAKKVDRLLDNAISPVYCCGETKTERETGTYQQVIRTQIEEGLFHLRADQFEKVVIAYEPVWAIGTGLTATVIEAQEVHAFIRSLVQEKYGVAIANNCSILYGGSVKPTNANELFGAPDIDGGLVGGASLKAASFLQIADSF